MPFFGICFGNQLFGRALGFGTYKLKYGHRGIDVGTEFTERRRRAPRRVSDLCVRHLGHVHLRITRVADRKLRPLARRRLPYRSGSCEEDDMTEAIHDVERIGPGDPRYRAVVDKRFNKRFSASPDYVRLAGSTEQVLAAVQAAVGEGRRLVVTSGGHCLEGFVSDPEVRGHHRRLADEAHRTTTRTRGAIAVEAGATVGETFRALAEQWGVVVPLGEYPGIGMGGHVAGGAFGFLCRQLGLAADYLYAVEVVTVDADGRAGSVVATREPSDPNRELWWAHTGAGGGNFGIVTRYWFRSPGAAGGDPAALLPRAPESIATFRAEWSWSDIDRPAFLRLLRNHGTWCERNSDAGSPHASLWTLLELHRKQFGKIVVRGVSTAGDGADAADRRLPRRARRRHPSRRAAASRRACRGSSSR